PRLSVAHPLLQTYATILLWQSAIQAKTHWSKSRRLPNPSRSMANSMKYWEIIADRLHAEGWSYGIAEHLTKRGLLYCVDAHRDGKRFIVKADDLLTAFLSLR